MQLPSNSDNNARTSRPSRYRFGNKLGTGVSGSVYLGVDEQTSQHVAIKVVKLSQIDNEVKNYLLKSETNALVGLHHPNIVRCLDIVHTDEDCQFVMEYCPDGTLNDLIKKRGKLPENQALAIIRGIVSGYKECKMAGVVHRDLKPTNILMAHGVPKITDFGFCEISGSTKPRIYYNVGSPSYMSPEAYMDNIYGEKSDVWSIGMIYYELLMGKTMLEKDQKIEEFYRCIHKGQRPIPSGVSELSQGIFNSCLQYSYQQRIGIVELDQMLMRSFGTNPFQIQNSQPQNVPHNTPQNRPSAPTPVPMPAPNSMPASIKTPIPQMLPHPPPTPPATLPHPTSSFPSADPRRSNQPKPFTPMRPAVHQPSFPSMPNMPPTQSSPFLQPLMNEPPPHPDLLNSYNEYYRPSNSPDARKGPPLQPPKFSGRLRGSMSVPKSIRPLAPKNLPGPGPSQMVHKQSPPPPPPPPPPFDGGRRDMRQPINIGLMRPQRQPPPPMFSMPPPTFPQQPPHFGFR